MGKLVIPGLSQQEKPIFEKFGIKLIESMEEEAFISVVIDYLNNHNTLSLATSVADEPRSTTVEYFNNGLKVYLLAEGGIKIANIKKNPKVSFTIQDPYHPEDDFFGASGLQVWAEATVFKKNDNPEKCAAIMTHFRNVDGLKQQGLYDIFNMANFNVVTISPYRIRYLNQRQGYRRVMWTKDESAGLG